VLNGDSSEFDTDTAVRSVGGGRWRGEVTTRWDVIGGAPNGGYLMTIALRALQSAFRKPDPITVTGHFLEPCPAGEVEVATQLVRFGRHATGTARLSKDGRIRILLTATLGELGAKQGPTHVTGEPPDLPPPEDCVVHPTDGDLPSLIDRFDLRFDPPSVGWAVGRPSGEARMDAWVRFADGREPDTLSLPLFADSLPPAVLNVVPQAEWVPTLELTVHVRSRPAPGWLRVSATTRFLVGGYLEEDVEIWDSTGELVALSRQLALVRTS
jgi:acyl-CoA thioesterase